MSKMKEISFFVSLYNEDKIIKENLTIIYQYLKNNFKLFELIIINDGSTDDSDIILKTLNLRNMRVMNFNNGPSRRENLGLAMKSAIYSISAFTDLDLAVDVSNLKKFISYLNNGNDIVIGSRYKGIKTKRSIYRKLISICYNDLLRIYFNSRIQDHQCGFKVFNTNKLKILIDELGYDKLFRRGWFWDAELLIRAQKHNLTIKELPVQWREGLKSSFKIRREIKIIYHMFKLKSNL